MPKIYTRWLAISVMVILAFSVLPGCEQKNNNSTEKLSEENNEYDGPEKAIEQEIERTKNPFTGRVPWEQLRIAVEQAEQAKAAARMDAIEALAWAERGSNGDFAGPQGNSRPNMDQTAGRIRAIMVDSLDPTHRTVFAGSVAGGLWRTTDITSSPANWTQVNDFLSNLAIADICQDPRPGFQNIMYLCTGESYFNADAVRGVGVFKSTDAGVTWNFLSSTNSFLNGTRILCDYLGNVYLGTRGTGLLRSTDGGTSWTNIAPSGLPNDICDLEISSTGVAGRLHVVTGINTTQGYRYTDIPTSVTSASGWITPVTPFPTFNERAEIAVSGLTLYALPVNASDQVPTVYKSIDGGDNWATAGSTPNTVNGSPFANGQGWYDLSVRINPANPDECIIGGIDCAKTTNGGITWTRISVWVGGSGQYVHADQHNILWWDGGTKLMFASDGGIFYSSDGGSTIRDRNKGLRIKQFYSIAIHPFQTNYFLAGAQDNGMHRLDHPGLDSSIEFFGGDGCYSAIDQNEPQYQFGTFVFNVYRRSTNNGVSWTTPVNSQTTGRFVNPWDYDNNTNIIYACNNAGTYMRWDNPQGPSAAVTNVVSVSAFGGGNVSAVHASPFTVNRVYFGTGIGGIIQIDDAHTGSTATGTVITPAGATGYVNCVVTGSSDQNLIACYSNYGVNNVWVSTNGGASWTASDGNLPNMPVRWALFNPDDNTKAYIATETGVWETDLLNGASTVWVPNTTFPNVRTDMIKYRASDRTIAAGTHGRGIWTATIPPPVGFDLGIPVPVTSPCPAGASMSTLLTTASIGGFTNPISFTATGAPAGTTVSFSPTSVIPGNPVTVTLNNTNILPVGSYIITVTGTAAGAPNIIRNLTFTINPGTGPTITLHPVSQTVCEGTNIVFTVGATGTYQWQVSTVAVPAFTNIPGATSASYTLNGVTAALNGNQYRSIVSGQCGNTISNIAVLTVNTAPAITSQPQSAEVCIGSSHTFNITATGTNITYQWQISTNGCAGPWVNIPGANSPSYTLTAITAGQNNTGYRNIVSGVCPSPVTSDCALLTVVTTVTVTTQPINQIVCEGSNASFTVAGSGSGIIYQWQVSTDGGITYNNVSNGGIYSGTTSATLVITGATFSLNNNRYRAQLSNATCPTPGISNSAILTVNTLPVISAQPQNITLCVGGSNTFSVTATGTGITYQWQLSTDGGTTYNNIAGAISPSYTVSSLTAGMNGNRYRNVVTGTCAPAATSAAAILTVISPVVITTQPRDTAVCSGSNPTFTVAGSSVQPINYQWQVSTDGGTTWTNLTGANAATYTITGAVVVMNNNRYRVLLSNATCTTPAISNEVMLTVRQLPGVGLTAAPFTSLLPGQTTTLTATPSASTGGTLSTTWYRNGAAFTNTGNMYVADVNNLGSYQVKIQESFAGGLTCFSESPGVIISATVSSKLFIFPSPNDGRFTVSYFNNSGTGTTRSVTVYDSKGSRVYGGKFTVDGAYTLLSIDLRPAQRGVYYVVVGDANGKKLAEGKVMVN